MTKPAANDLFGSLKAYATRVLGDEMNPEKSAAALSGWLKESSEALREKVEKEVLSDSESTELQSVKFPGEILDEPSANDSSKLHFTQLNISTKIKETNINNNEISISNDDNNLVVPFELDPDYDYSQHIFTPRYTH